MNLLGNLFEVGIFAEVCVFGLGNLGGVLVFVLADDGDDLLA